MPTGFKIADAYVAVRLDRDDLRNDLAALPGQLNNDVDKAGRDAGRRLGQSIGDGVDTKTVGKKVGTDLDRALTPEMDKAGKKNGDKLSQGIQLAMVRNSPLIAAAVGGALAAGAPVALAGAAVLFGGIGVAAAAQSAAVGKHWADAWTGIIDGTVEDATVLQHTVANMADQIAKGFSTLRPALRSIFADTAPLLESFTGSLIKMAQNAMPGLVAAVHAAGPVFAGLGSLMEDIGSGLSNFFQIISEHSQAAGTAFAAIGKIVAALLPILGDLLGQGAELASVVLPPLASALGVVADVLHAIAPVLPAVAAGFGAFKIVQALSGPLSSFGTSLSNLAAKNIPGLSSAAGAASSAVGKLGSALPAIGTALGLVGAVVVQAQQQIQQWAQALLDGGAAAQQATAQMQGIEDFFNGGVTGISSATMGWTNWANALGVGSNASETAKQKAQELYDAMSPLQQAQQDVTTAQNNLSVAVATYGPNSSQAAAASDVLTAAQGRVTAQSQAEQLAIQGVTDAMLAQANQALANASSSFAYDQATQQVADAQARLTELQNSGKASASDLNNATNSLNQALLAQVQAAGRLASDALPASASETQKATAANSAMLQQLYQLKDTMGSAFPAALQNAINGLVASGATAGNYSAAAYNAMGATQNFIGSLGILGAQHPNPTISVNDQASGPAYSIRASINSIPVSKTVYVNVIGKNVLASGGRVEDNTKVIKAASGKLVGPGTDTSDSIPAIGPGGARWALSNNEWVIRAAAAKHYGDDAMAAINAGVAQVSVPSPRLPTATSTGTSGGMTKVQGGAVNVTVNINGVAFADSVELPRRLTETIRKELIKVDRETR